MLQVHQLRKSFGTQLLFDGVTFALTPGERLGLVGRNGSGKTTLFRLILGEEPPDDGRIDKPRDYSIGHVSQHLQFEADTVLKEACLGLPVQEGGWVEEYKAEEALMGLGFKEADFHRPPGEFSGGYQVRLQLAKALVSAPDLLLLDEPTNYLDIVSMRWLQRYLRSWAGEIILITHDRNFMDRVTTHSMAIHRGKVRRVAGPTDKLYEMLAVEEEIHEKTRQNQEKSRRDAERFIDRFRYQATKARQVQSRVKMLKKQGTMDQLEEISTLSFKFNAAPFHAHSLLRAADLEFGYGADGPTLIEDLSVNLEMGDRVAIVGKNGKGKSTLLNLIADELTPRRGQFKRHDAMRVAHFGQTNIDRLHADLTVEEEIMSSVPDRSRGTARGICGLMMFQGDDALKKVRVLSGGERARVLIGKLLVSPANLVLLDEPTNHLDMQSIDSLIEALLEFPGGMIVVTHNELVLHAVATKLVVFDRGGVSWFDGTYRDFLDRVGWSDEDDGKRSKQKKGKQDPAPKPKGQPGGGKRARKERAKIVAERTAALQPLKRQIKKLEDAIMKLEAELEPANQALEQAAQDNDKDAIVRCSIEVAEVQKKVDAEFAELERVSTEHDERKREFDQKMDALGG